LTTVPTATDLVVNVEQQPGSRVTLKVEAPAVEVDAALEDALRRLAGRVRLPGFRPGKAPTAMVERAVGWEVVKQETVERLVPVLYTRALVQAGVEAVDDPQLDVGELQRGLPLSFSATVTVKPEVDLGDYTALRLDEEHTEIDDDRVASTLEEVRSRHAELVDAGDRPAQSGDVVRCTLTMRRDGEVLGGEGEERDVELDREKLVPGLVDGIVGLRAGESHTIELTLPDDYAQEELRGVAVAVEANVLAVRERRLPPLDDALAVLDGHGTTLDELRDHYRQALIEAAGEADRERYEAGVLEAIRDSAAVDLPEAMVDREIDRQLREMEIRLAAAGLRFDKYLEYTGQTLERIRGERREAAAQRVKLELVLEALAAAEGLEVDESDVEREEARLASGRKLTREQRQRIHQATHRDLLFRGAARRAMEIARGQG
jgi:trigger factor